MSYHGWLLLDKPEGISSAQAVGKIKHLLDKVKTGHAGTLDPFASGLLPIALGAATKTVPYMMMEEKTYQFSAKWGVMTDSLDMTGTIIEAQPHATQPALHEVQAMLPQFIGKSQQIPPDFSALKVNGKRAYALARQGIKPALQPREIDITKLQAWLDDKGEMMFECTCSKGTYIRALLRDIAFSLGMMASCQSLRRLRIGKFDIKDAIMLETLTDLGHKEAAREGVRALVKAKLLAPADVLDGIPAFTATAQEYYGLKQGHPLPLYKKGDFKRIAHLHQGETMALLSQEHHLIGFGQYAQGMIKPNKILNYS